MVTLAVTLAALAALIFAILASNRAILSVIPAALGVASVVFATSKMGVMAPYIPAVLSSLAFLVFAVPLGILLDELGFFAGVAALIPPRMSYPVLWILAAAVTTLMNLDASVVLLTPLYYHYAKRNGLSPMALAFQPVILSFLASSALPVSNLTNLIVVGVRHISTGQFIENLGPPSLVALLAGYFLWRRYVNTEPEIPQPYVSNAESSRSSRALFIGAGASVALLIGFVVGPYLNVSPWEVAAGVDVALVVAVRRFRLSWLPISPALSIGGIALAALALGSRLHLAHLLRGTGPMVLAVLALGSGILSNFINNIPAVTGLMVSLGHVPRDQLWAILLGVNMGSSALLIGTLATILWLSIVRRLGLHVSSRSFFLVAYKVTIPSFLAGLGVLLLMQGIRA